MKLFVCAILLTCIYLANAGMEFKIFIFIYFSSKGAPGASLVQWGSPGPSSWLQSSSQLITFYFVFVFICICFMVLWMTVAIFIRLNDGNESMLTCSWKIKDIWYRCCVQLPIRRGFSAFSPNIAISSILNWTFFCSFLWLRLFVCLNKF